MMFKMLLKVLVFAILGAVVSGSKLCFNNQMKNCLPEDIKTIANQQVCDKTTTCLTTAAETCKEKDDATIKSVIASLKDMCNPDSELRKKLDANTDCFTQVSQNKLACSAGIVKILVELKINPLDLKSITEEQMNKITKAMCPQQDTIKSCILKVYKDTCKDTGEDLFNMIEEPGMKLTKEVCIEINHGLNLKANLWSILLQILLVVALFKWSKM